MNTVGVYDDTDNKPLLQCDPNALPPAPATPTEGKPYYAPGCKEDPIHGDIYYLNPANYFTQVFDKKLASNGDTAMITFNTMGSVTQMPNLTNNTVNIRNSKVINTVSGKDYSYSGGVSVDLVAGSATIIAPSVKPPSP